MILLQMTCSDKKKFCFKQISVLYQTAYSDQHFWLIVIWTKYTTIWNALEWSKDHNIRQLICNQRLVLPLHPLVPYYFQAEADNFS
jgi:hypothetical protein